MTLKQEVLHGLRWTAGARFASQFITWAVTIVVMRLLTPGDYGLLNMATVFVAFLGMFSEFGLGAAIVRAPEVDDAALRRMLGLVLLIHSALCVALSATSPLIAAFFAEPRVTGVVIASSLQFPISAFMIVPEALLQRRMEFRKRSLLNLTSALFQCAVTLSLAWMGRGVWALVWGNLAGVTWQTIGTNLLAPCPRLPTFTTRGARDVLRFGGDITLARLLSFFYLEIDSFLGGKLLGAISLGYYAVAKHLGTLTIQRVSSILNQVAYPAFVKVQNEPQLLASHLLKAIRMLCFVSFPVQWGIASIAPELVRVLLGSRWEPVVLPLQLISAVVPLRFIQHLLPAPLTAIGRTRVMVRILAANCLVYPPAFWIASRWGIAGFSLVWAAAAPFVLVWNLSQAMPALSVPVGAVLRALVRPVANAAAMAAAVFAARAMLPWAPLPRMLALIAVGAGAYAGLALAFDRSGVREVRSLVRR